MTTLRERVRIKIERELADLKQIEDRAVAIQRIGAEAYDKMVFWQSATREYSTHYMAITYQEEARDFSRELWYAMQDLGLATDDYPGKGD